MNEKSLTFPRSIHGENIIAFAFMYYVRMRMRQFSYQENKSKKSENSIKKKNSKVLQNLIFNLICTYRHFKYYIFKK
jgi:hypothetical protein